MRYAVSILLLFALAACGGNDNNTPAATQSAPEDTVAETVPVPITDPNSLPPEILTAIASQGQPGSTPVAGQSLPFEIPNSQNPSFPFAEMGNGITDFSELQPGAQVSLIGQLEIVPVEEGEQNLPILRDGDGNEILLNIALPLVQSQAGQTVQITGTLSESPTAGGRLVLENPDLSGGTPDSLPDFLQGLSQQLENSEATAEAQAPAPLQALNPSTVDIQLEAGITALQTYDTLIEALGQEAISGLNWISITGNTGVGWVIQFDNPNDAYGVEYLVSVDGSVQTRIIPLESIAGTNIIPMERSRIVVDSPQAVNQLEAQQGLLTLRAANPDEYYWLLVGTENTLLATGE